MNKKEFQKIISAIRKERGEGYCFPKAMMTAQQIEKGTATVNCGGEWTNLEKSHAIAELVINDERFKTLIIKANAIARIELNSFGTEQIRINY